MSKTNKAPAFQLFAGDLLTDTMTWTAQELGVHIRLLCWSWVNGPLPLDLKRMARLDPCAPDVWATVGEKWTQGEDGWTNDRLERSRADQTAYRERQSERGKASARARAERVEPTPDAPTPKVKPDAKDIGERVLEFERAVHDANKERTGAGQSGPLPPSEVGAFIAYWTQRGEGDRKTLAEKQRVFDIPKRLTLWASKVNWSKYQASGTTAKQQAKVMDRSAPIEGAVKFVKPTTSQP
jgi:uncharacterized protein YdaU (DUF1376 family)